MSTTPSLDLRSSWPALQPQEAHPQRGPDLDRLQELLAQAVAAVRPADRGDLARVLEATLGKLLARMAEGPGDERLSLKEGLVLTGYSVRTWAELTAKKLRPTRRVERIDA